MTRFEGPVVAVLSTHREAAYTVADLNRAGFAMRKILIISNDFPADEVAGKIKQWPAVRSAWATIGCLNAIGIGLDFLGMHEEDIRRCHGALDLNHILVILKGTPKEVLRARLACPVEGTLARRIRI